MPISSNLVHHAVAVQSNGWNNNRCRLHLPSIQIKSVCCYVKDPFPILSEGRALEDRCIFLLKNCRSFDHLTQIHAHVFRRSIHYSSFVVTKLLALCFSLREPTYALRVFDQFPHPNAFLWNTVIRSLVDIQAHHHALLFYSRMLESGSLPNSFTFPFVLKACSKLFALTVGKTVHALILKLGFGADVYTQAALLGLYGSCQEIANVGHLLDRMPERDTVCWNAALVCYLRCGVVNIAEELFEAMPIRNVSSWTAMIGGWVQSGKPAKALDLFRRMQMDGLKPDGMLVVSVLSAVTELGALDLGRWVHDFVVKNGIRVDAFVGTSLIDMYSKCGDIEAARSVFDAIGSKTTACYNAMIMGFAIHGMGEEAIKVFRDAEEKRVGIDDVTMVAILNACSHSGLVEEGYLFFISMTKDHGIEAKLEHYRCMVDILGKAGRLKDALKMVMSSKVDHLALGMLASACQIHGNVQLAVELVQRVLESDPVDGGLLALRSTLYAADGRWEEAAAAKRFMKDEGIRSRPGCSWIEVNNVVHEFVAGGHSHPLYEEINSVLTDLSEMMKSYGSKDWF